jgi:hypothetical protein
LKINKILSGIGALALGSFLTALPAAATTMTFTTAATPGTVAAAGETANTFFNYIDASGVPSFDPSTQTNFGVSNPSSANSFGGFTFITNTAPPNGTSSVVTVALTPTINGGKVAAVDFSGTVSAVSNSSYSISFSGTPGATNTAGGYTDLTSNGITYAIETTQTLNASGAGKQAWLQGYILGVPAASTPEPATLTTTGIALCLVGFGIRRRAKAKS